MLRPVAALSLAAALLAACGTPRPTGRDTAADTTDVARPPPTPPRPDVLVARARALRAEGDLAGARARLEAAYEVSPGSDDVRIELADLLVADGREVERAGALLSGVGEREGARLHVVEARLAELRGDEAGAEAAYGRALLAGDDPDVRLSRALVLERLARHDEAIAELERVRLARPDDLFTGARLAERYEAAGRHADAEAELTRAAEAQPERAAAWERLARFYERTGRAAQARAALARAREVEPRPGRALRPLLPSKR